jgi:hypothetical protein
VTGGAGGLSVFGNFGGGGAQGGVNLGGGIGCGGMAAGYVPWCQQVGGLGMISAQAVPVQQQVQVQQVPAVVHHHHPQVVRQVQRVQQGHTYPPEVPGFGTQGSIALPGGGGGRWSSWYGNSGQYQPRQYGKPNQSSKADDQFKADAIPNDHSNISDPVFKSK